MILRKTSLIRTTPWDWSALLLGFVFFPLHWTGITIRRISNEITESEWLLLLLFHRRALVVRLNCLVRLVSRYGLNVLRLAIMVGEHCDRCSSQPVVYEMWLNTCFLTSLSSHPVERSFTKMCAAKPDFVVCGIELLALTICWSLKKSMWRWIEMAQVVLERFYWISFRSHLRIRFIFSMCKAALVIFCSRQGTSWLLFSSKYSTSCGVFRRESIAGQCQLSLVFTSTSSKNEANIEPSRPLQLGGIQAVGLSDVPSVNNPNSVAFFSCF